MSKTLQMKQALPLEIKLAMTKRRLVEFVDYFGLEKVYISYSGGKDSEVLCHIANEIYPNIKMCFSNTGMELPETIKQIYKRKKEGWNIDIVKPKLTPFEVWTKYGYPVVSKEQSGYVHTILNTKSDYMRNLRIVGSKKGYFRLADKWVFLLRAPFKIHNACCDKLKKDPLKKYEKETGRHPIIATMAGESQLRRIQSGRSNCNAFETKRPSSKPITFWTTDDIYQYIEEKNIEISEAYTKHGMERTGCYGCLYGCHQEEKKTGTNRIVELKKTHPFLWKNLMYKLGYEEVMDFIGLRKE